MTNLQNKQLAFLEDTINHYNSGNRSQTSSGGCKYSPAHSNTLGCAIGRHIPDKDLCKKLDECGFGVDSYMVFKLLPENLKELGKEFLVELQMLHDSLGCWDENGLSDKGKEKVDRIKKQFNLEN